MAQVRLDCRGCKSLAGSEATKDEHVAPARRKKEGPYRRRSHGGKLREAPEKLVEAISTIA